MPYPVFDFSNIAFLEYEAEDKLPMLPKPPKLRNPRMTSTMTINSQFSFIFINCSFSVILLNPGKSLVYKYILMTWKDQLIKKKENWLLIVIVLVILGFINF